MKKLLFLALPLCLLAGGFSISLLAQGPSGPNSNAASGKGKKSVFIRGEEVGFVSISPALQQSIAARSGNRANPNPGAMGPNAEVTSTGFTYVSPSAKGKAKGKDK